MRICSWTGGDHMLWVAGICLDANNLLQKSCWKRFNCLENDHTHMNLCNNLHLVSSVNKWSQFDGEDCLFSIKNILKISFSYFCTVNEFLDVDLSFRFNVDLKNFLGLGIVSLSFILHKLKDTNKTKATISTTKNHSNCDPTKCCSFGFLHMLREAPWEIETLLMLHCSFMTPYLSQVFPCCLKNESSMSRRLKFYMIYLKNWRLRSGPCQKRTCNWFWFIYARTIVR